MFRLCARSHCPNRSRAARRALGFIRSTAAVATLLLAGRADAINYIVNDEDSCLAFLTAIGASDEDPKWAGELCYVYTATLPEGDSLFIQGVAGIRPQSGTFTNRGEIIINATENGAGFYGAGTFVNEGTVHIFSADQPRNFHTIRNFGTFTTDVDFYNNGAFANVCGGTVDGTIVGNPVTESPDLPCEYVVKDEASCEEFLIRIGASDENFKWAGDLCYVYDAILPEGHRLVIEGEAGIRPQSETFTNRGEIIVNATGNGAGFYGAGNFVNEGTVHIVTADQPRNFTRIRNSGTFTTDVDFYNNGTFTNDCGATINGTVLQSPVTNTPNQFPCGEAVDPPGIGAGDALVTLQSAVGVAECPECNCDTDASGSITADDALAVLRRGTGQDAQLRCPCCEIPAAAITTKPE